MAKLDTVTSRETGKGPAMPSRGRADGRIDLAKVATTSEEEIRRHAREDGNLLSEDVVLRRQSRRGVIE